MIYHITNTVSLLPPFFITVLSTQKIMKEASIYDYYANWNLYKDVSALFVAFLLNKNNEDSFGVRKQIWFDVLRWKSFCDANLILLFYFICVKDSCDFYIRI